MTKEFDKQLLTIFAAVVFLFLPAAASADEPAEDFSVQWIGTATVLINYGGTVILTDPAFDPPGGKYDLGFAILEKTKGPAIAPEDIENIDFVLLSHDQDFDNFDCAGREIISKAQTVFVTKEGAKRLGGHAVGLAHWRSYRFGDITVTAVPARHGPPIAEEMIGPVNGFIVSAEGKPTIYFSGDTVPFSGTDELIERYRGKIDYAILDAGAVAQGELVEGKEKLTYFTMTADEAIQLAEGLDAKQFSIIHVDSWKHFRELLPTAMEKAKASPISNRLLDLSDHRLKAIPFE